MIVAGASAYSRFIDFAGFRRIADEIGLGGQDGGQLGAEVLILGGVGFKAHDRAGAVLGVEVVTENFGQALGIVVVEGVENRGRLGAELFHGEVHGHGTLEGVKEGGAENPGAVLGGVGVGGPGRDHRSLIVVADLAGRDCLLAGVGADDGQHAVALDELESGGDGGFCLGLVVFVDERLLF